jgi:hypothetical protein
MIDVKQAVANAVKFLTDMFAGEPIMDVRLEEVELSEDGQYWYITLSMLRKPGESGRIPSVAESLQSFIGRMDREYKVLAVRAQDGQVQSMKIRQLV